MRIYVLDFETYYDQDYSLKAMTNEEYVRDARFEALCLAVKPFGEDGFVLPDAEMVYWLKEQDWSQIAVIMHHAHFDGFILSEKHNVRPAFYFDILSMARAVNGPLEKASLEDLARRYSLEPKSVPYNRFRGRRWNEMDESLRIELCDGCLHDAVLTEIIFRQLCKTAAGTPSAGSTGCILIPNAPPYITFTSTGTVYAMSPTGGASIIWANAS